MRVMSAECPMGGGCPMSVKGVTGNPLFSFRSTSEEWEEILSALQTDQSSFPFLWAIDLFRHNRTDFALLRPLHIRLPLLKFRVAVVAVSAHLEFFVVLRSSH